MTATLPAPPTSAPSSEADLTPIIAANLRRLRVKRGLSLERLARLTTVSRAMLGQIELGQSTPTINVMWKIAHGLGVPFSALITEKPRVSATLLPHAEAKILESAGGGFSTRSLFPFDRARKVEFYELRLQPQTTETADGHALGTTENLVVVRGQLEIEVEGQSYRLGPGDALHFEADAAHVYRSSGESEVLAYLVVTYTDEVGGE